MLERRFRAAGLARTERAATPRGGGPDRRRDRPRGARAAGATPGPATVLLSPAAASFDMFVDYAARGRAFKEAVAAIAAERRRREDPMSDALPAAGRCPPASAGRGRPPTARPTRDRVDARPRPDARPPEGDRRSSASGTRPTTRSS